VGCSTGEKTVSSEIERGTEKKKPDKKDANFREENLERETSNSKVEK